MDKVILKKHRPELSPYFRKLNIEWLKKYFTVEDIDEKYFANIDGIIADGGHIIYTEYQGQIVGCCALLHHGNAVYELAKMGVTEDQQGLGIGKILLNEMINVFNSINGKKLYLETNSVLKPAIHLYEKYGFVKKTNPLVSEYARSDYYMEYSGK